MLARREAERIGLDIEILEYRNRKFVTGLHWEPLNSALKYKKEAKDFASRYGWDVVAYRRARGGIQGGFVSTNDGAYKRMYSIAATLAGELAKDYGDRWVGLFKVSEGMYLFAGVWDGMIIPATDRIVSRVEASGAFAEVLNRYSGDKGKIEDRCQFAPPELELAAQEIKLSDVLEVNKLRRDYQLKALTFTLTPSELRMIAAAGVIALVAWQGVDKWHDMQREKALAVARAQAAARAAALAEANANARKKLAESALAHPWAVLPSARDYVDACEGATDMFPLNIAGWSFATATCAGSQLTVVYQRKEGTTQGAFGETIGQGLVALANARATPVLGFSDAGSTATITMQLAYPVAGDDALLPEYEATSAFLGTLEPANSSDLQVISGMNIKEQAATIKLPPPPPGTPATEPPQAPWRHYAFSFDSQLQPQAIMASMQLGNGLRINSIVTKLNVDSAALIWTISGDLYVKR
ncbi:type 4b pilus protein PilO2 [Paraburkholderia domus]|uniref:type 4b pilus protein PilO2 n=1 Tax=Paraburkholderia domus TaxID=2793075 RepID=UPI001EEFF05F|nr:type 4b pilus protein PilO2 [Paraburkholderia domus]